MAHALGNQWFMLWVINGSCFGQLMRRDYSQFANINNLIAMKNQQGDNLSTSQPVDANRKMYGDNPISAINKLKSINNNIEMMKNRYLVLRRRDEHNKYKTLDQEKKLSFHHMIHDRLKSERDELRRSLEEIRDTKQIKQRSQTIRKQIQDGINNAKKQLLTSNLQKYEQISEEAVKHKEAIDINKSSEISANRSRAISLKNIEQQEKEIIQRKLKAKRQHILANKSIDSHQLIQKSVEGEKLIHKLEKDQMEMIRETSKSMENSRLMSQKFTEIMMNLPSFRGKKQQKGEPHSFLPAIKPKNHNNHTLQVVIV